ncbi:MAG: tetratricopeptide repeat protein [Pyrinomonadaceae bacterium]
MNKSFVWISVLAVLIAFAGGFLLANALNRSEFVKITAENERLKNSNQTPENPNEKELSVDEVKQKIAQADQNPDNFDYQKNLGIGLYRYATVKQNPEMLIDVERLLKRAYDKNPKDQEVLVFFGNTLFDIGYAKKDNAKFEQARKIYAEALAQKPKDVDIQTDFGLTYFYENPPQDEKAITELKKALALKPDHERSLQYIAQIYARQNQADESEKYLAELRKVNPKNPIFDQLQMPQAGNPNQ